MNLLPGIGLGFSGSKEIAFGLAPVLAYEPVLFISPPQTTLTGGRGGGYDHTVYDNAYSAKKDDSEVLEILCCIISVIE
jgi:hypothetical protein